MATPLPRAPSPTPPLAANWSPYPVVLPAKPYTLCDVVKERPLQLSMTRMRQPVAQDGYRILDDSRKV